MSQAPCTLWLDREAVDGDTGREFWPDHLAECRHCRREHELDRLLAAQRIAVDPGFSRSVMRVVASHRRRWGLGAVAASVALIVVAGWALGATSGGGLGATLLALFADALTVGWGWLGASWAGVRMALRTTMDPLAVVGLALLAAGVGGFTWGLLRRRVRANQRSDR